MRSKEGYMPLSCLCEKKLQVCQSLAIGQGVLECLHDLHSRDICQKNLSLDDYLVKKDSTVSFCNITL